uniref:Uncharacterized protein n=1 Tax=Neogobius melanostomus TaxID=47308 RepID=A0A8C6WFD7_9GOBI
LAMASVSCRLSEEQFLCSICLEVFSAPVTTPCGHSFCSACINLHWDSSDSITCPLCKQDLSSTPHLKVNTVLAEMVSQLKVTPEDEDLVTEKEISELQSSAPVEVDCEESAPLSQKNADSEIQEGIRVFNTLIECVQQSLDSFKQSIEEKHRKSEEEAAQLIEKIQTEISALEQREAEMERLWSSGDHLQFVQTFTSTKPAPPLKDWTEETVRAPSYEGRVAKAVSELERNLYPQMEQIFEAELKKVREFEVEVTLDPDTANPNLVLSEDLKQVHYCDQQKDLPDNPERFSCLVNESVTRKEENTQTPQNGHWLIYMSDDEYKTEEEPPVFLPMRSTPEKVGVFVDYDEGLISFYDVGKKNLIYSFTDCCFTENILPLLNPCDNQSGTNSAPLVLTPVAGWAERCLAFIYKNTTTTRLVTIDVDFGRTIGLLEAQ